MFQCVLGAPEQRWSQTDIVQVRSGRVVGELVEDSLDLGVGGDDADRARASAELVDPQAGLENVSYADLGSVDLGDLQRARCPA